MADDLVIVATFETAVEAELARQTLEREGIRAVLGDELTVATLSYVGPALGGVKLLVRAPDRARSEELLAATRRAAAQPNDEGANHWLCPDCCSEVPADFDICWHCGTTRDGQKVADFNVEQVETDLDGHEAAFEHGANFYIESTTGNVIATDDSRSLNPYRAPSVVAQVAPEPVVPPADTAEGDRVAVRAWRAAVLSPFLCPPLLTFYSVWLILRIALVDMELSDAGKTWYYWAMLLNIAVWIVVVIITAYFF